MTKIIRFSVPVLASVFAFGAVALAGGGNAPSITSIVPSSGPMSGGTSITINGAHLGGVTVTIGGSAATNVIVASNSQSLTATTPAGTLGAKDVVVSSTNGTATSTGGFTYTLQNQATLTVTGLPTTATYGQSGITAGTSGGSGTGTVTFSSGASTACSIGSSSGAISITHGTGTCSITATKAADSTYSATTSAAVSVTVSKATVTATVSAANKTYDGTTAATISSCTPAPILNSDNLTCSVGSATFSDKNVGTGKTVTATGITLGGTKSAEYQLSSTSTTTTANITVNNITITADAKAKNYGASDPSLTYQVTSGALGSGDSFTGSLTRDAGEDVGAYAIKQGSVALNGNYNLSYVGANLTIGQATVNVTADAKSKTYGDTDPNLTYVATGLLNGDTLSGALSRASGENVGTYAITQNTLSAGSNYNISYTGANLTINKANATVNVTPYSVTYDASAHSASATATGVHSEDLSSGFTLTGTSHTSVGDYPSDAWSFNGGTNYNNQSGSAHDVITKANATVAVTPYSVNYDGSAHTATGSATGVGTDGTLSGLDLSGTTHTNIGTYTGDLWSFTDVTGNYNNATGTVTDVINPFVAFGGAGGDTNTTPTPPVGKVLGVSTSTVPEATSTEPTSTTTPPVTQPTPPAGKVLGASTFVFNSDLRYRMRGSDVSELQKLLVSLGFSIPDAVTDYFGTQTRAAVKAFQKAHNLPQTGIVGALTRAALNAVGK